MQTVWVDPELLLEHQGVRVFQTYREDDYGQGARDYWFTANSLCGELDRLCDDQPCRHVFDVRELSTWKAREQRSEEHTSELQSHSFISYAVFCLKKKN